jgi:hypothetical protein
VLSRLSEAGAVNVLGISAQTRDFEAMPYPPPLLPAIQPSQVVQNARRRGGDTIDRIENLLTSDRAYFQSQLRGLLKILQIVVNGDEGLLEGFRALGRHLRRGGERPRHLVSSANSISVRASRLRASSRAVGTSANSGWRVARANWTRACIPLFGKSHSGLSDFIDERSTVRPFTSPRSTARKIAPLSG